MLLVSSVVFFFSSRRRHTRLQGDWSSDVCSSDLDGFSFRTTGSRRPWFSMRSRMRLKHSLYFASRSGGQLALDLVEAAFVGDADAFQPLQLVADVFEAAGDGGLH